MKAKNKLSAMKPDARRLRRLRKRVLKISQTSLGAYLGVTYFTVLAWEKCHSPVPRSVMLAVNALAEQTKQPKGKS